MELAQSTRPMEYFNYLLPREIRLSHFNRQNTSMYEIAVKTISYLLHIRSTYEPLRKVCEG